MEPGYIEFDESLSRVYRKVGRVLAFRSKDPFDFHKSWDRQSLPEGSWIIVPLVGVQSSDDVYGCDGVEFAKTYQPVAAGQPHTYEKRGVVHAYRPGTPFIVRTVVRGRVEVDRAKGGAMDWLVRNTHGSGEIYRVSDLTFLATYVPVE